MKIGHIDTKLPVAPLNSDRKASAAEPGTAASSAAGAKPEPAALVELSATAAALSHGGVDTSFDSAKVDRVSQSIRDGKYKIDPEAIADKLIANARDVLGRKQG